MVLALFNKMYIIWLIYNWKTKSMYHTNVIVITHLIPTPIFCKYHWLRQGRNKLYKLQNSFCWVVSDTKRFWDRKFTIRQTIRRTSFRKQTSLGKITVCSYSFKSCTGNKAYIIVLNQTNYDKLISARCNPIVIKLKYDYCGYFSSLYPLKQNDRDTGKL